MGGRARTALVVALTGALLTACGGSGGDTDDDQDGGTPSSGPSSSSTTTPATATTPSGTPSTAAEDYLPVPDGLTLTEPGSVLRFKKAALVAWTPRQDLVGVVGVKVRKVERTTVKKSLQGYQLAASARASRVYFVRTLVGNGGETDLGGRQLPIYVVDTQDRLVAATGIDNAFKPCPGSVLPAVFAPGDRAESCLIFLVPPDAELASVMFRPPEGVVPITWEGKVTRLGAEKLPAGEDAG